MGEALAAFAFAPGLAVGSFLNVVAARLPLHRSIVTPGSACPSCGTPIAWFDNIPVVSYVALRGRCRGCRAGIGWQYPAVELTTALLISACLLRFGLTAEALVAAFFCAVLVTLTVTDFERRVLPNRIVLPSAAIVLVAQTAIDPSLQWTIAAAAGAAAFFAVALAYPGGLGMGDVKLLLLLGAMLGRTLPVAVMIGVLSALAPAIVLIARHRGRARRMGIPLGPFLALGSLVALFYGGAILNFYLGLR